MKKVIFLFVLAFLIFGILLHAPLVFADKDKSGSNKGSDSNSGSNSIKDNSRNSEDSDENETEREDDKNKSRVRERTREETKEGNCTIRIERELKIEDGKRVESVKRKIECADGTKTEIKIRIENRTEDGRVRERVRYEIKGEEIEVEAEDEIKFEEETNETEYRLKARLKDGNVTDIKIMPHQASEIALKRLRALNFTIELREVTDDRNIPHVVYNIKTNKHGRFLGVFKLSMKVEGQVDPETGEFIGISKPWWAFLVAGEDLPDESLIEGKTEIKAENFNGTSEIKVELQFGTKAIEQEQIVDEILDRLSDLNVSSLLEVEEEDKAIEGKEKLEIEAKVEEGFAEVEFELRFVINSDNREDIINAIRERLSALTAQDIGNALELETEDEGDDETDTNETEITEIMVNLTKQNDSGEFGTATLTEEDGQVVVTLNLVGVPQNVSQPAHIHNGSCLDVAGVIYPLTNVLNGESTTTINVTFDQLEDELPLAINIHQSVENASVYVACGDIEFS